VKPANRFRPWWIALCAGCLLAFPQLGWCGFFDGVSVGGFLKTTNASVQPSALNTGDGAYSFNEQRVFLKDTFSEMADGEVAVENRLYLADSPMNQLTRYLTRDVNRRLDMTSTLDSGRYHRDIAEVDRLVVSVHGESDELSVGRQAVGFGRMALVSPLDVVNPFSADALDTDTRSGVDAIRAVHYFGLGGQLGGTLVMGDNDADNSYLATTSYNAGGLDMLGIGGRLRSRCMAGAGLAGELKGVGLKAEFVQYQGRSRIDADTPGDLYDSFPIGGVEAWYRFDNGLEMLVEYLYNGAGAGSPRGYADAVQSASMQEGMTSLAGQQYLLLRPSYELHSLVTLQALAILNLKDRSALIRPELDISLSDNTQLQLFVGVNTGPGPHDEPSPAGTTVPRSEFGTVNNYAGFSLKYYF